VIGSEYACTFAALGARVHVVDARDVLLPFLDHEISRALTGAMQKLGIVFHWNEHVVRCDTSDPATIPPAAGNRRDAGERSDPGDGRTHQQHRCTGISQPPV
jgi:pyruvate/2-oxoglutarate dehydrogenase complex dihydrolipoamide dehydrogenase (E3) component